MYSNRAERATAESDRSYRKKERIKVMSTDRESSILKEGKWLVSRKGVNSPSSLSLIPENCYQTLLCFTLVSSLESFSAVNLCLEMLLSPLSVRISSGKGLQWESSLNVEQHWTKPMDYYPHGQPTSESGHHRLWWLYFSLFNFNTLVHTHHPLLRRYVWVNRTSFVQSLSVCVWGVSSFILCRNFRQRIRLVGWSLSIFLLLNSQILHYFPNFKRKLEENIQVGICCFRMRSPEEPQGPQWEKSFWGSSLNLFYLELIVKDIVFKGIGHW